MAENTRLYWLHALTPLHVGAGRGVGYIDLPIMREKVTNWPLVPGSTVKGVLADYYNATDEKRRSDAIYKAAFGTADAHEGTRAGANSGSLVFTDARLVCLPVRSIYGTFAWCTSPMSLRRLHRDLEAAGMKDALQAPIVTDGKIHVPQVSELTGGEDRVFLEDLDLPACNCNLANAWASKLATWLFTDSGWQDMFKARFAVVPDEVFDFLCETGTEVAARVRINDDTKTVETGALWYEEALPCESLLCGLVWCDRVFGSNGESAATPGQLLDRFCRSVEKPPLQIGGKATVGRGQVRCIFCS